VLTGQRIAIESTYVLLDAEVLHCTGGPHTYRHACEIR
jgi:hypothetical protein